MSHGQTACEPAGGGGGVNSVNYEVSYDWRFQISTPQYLAKARGTTASRRDHSFRDLIPRLPSALHSREFLGSPATGHVTTHKDLELFADPMVHPLGICKNAMPSRTRRPTRPHTALSFGHAEKRRAVQPMTNPAALRDVNKLHFFEPKQSAGVGQVGAGPGRSLLR